MAEFAGKGMAGSALGIGIGALALELLRGRGGLGGLLGGGGGNEAALAMDATMLADRFGDHNRASCSHFELRQAEDLGRARAELDALRAERYADRLALEAERGRGALEAKIDALAAKVAVDTQRINDNFRFVEERNKETKTWVKAHFVPGVLVLSSSSVAAVTPPTEVEII